MQIIYIEASEGNASGGHIALQLGDEVFHYQYEDKLIRLFEHNADAFRVNYQIKQNRSLHIADVEVSDAAYDRIRDHFKLRYFEQKQRLKQLQALQQDQFLLRALLHWKTGKLPVNPTETDSAPKLQGAGLFYSGNDLNASTKTAADCNTAGASVKILADVKQQLESTYGKNFLPQKIVSLRAAINQLSPALELEVVSSPFSFSERYSDLLNALLAVQVMQKSQPLASSTCFEIKLPELRLNDADIKHLQVFQQNLLHSVQSLLLSKRPDWGYALFVTLARLIVIEQSLQTRQWTFLDDTDEVAAAIPKQQLALYPGHIQKLRHDDLKHLQKAASGLTAHPTGYERHYTLLEMAANRYQQWLVSDKTEQLRYQSERTLPKKAVAVSHFLLTNLSAEQLEKALHQQERATERLLSADNDRYPYHLVTRNCVTALFEHINAALAGQSKDGLGGFIDPKVNFIPFQAFDSVQAAYNVVNTRELPAYRRQALAKMYNREVDSWVYARESNVFSSSLYRYNPEDAWFVFFTDDTFILRPLFGAVNTLAATGQSLWGLFQLPFDGGRAIKIGARGVLTSLPELAFFNIRKGSYPYPIEP